mmetsp:Transcript_5293/g.7318  ORF Transcript_5293/g.7318 Transcript_5293/m.7318 type:complete len:142 (+) Transcript_5293:52-477(+)
MIDEEDSLEYNEKKIFVGNLPFTIQPEDLEQLFRKFGEVIGVNIRKDRSTDKPKGFAFVTFDSEESASSAIATLNGHSLHGRILTVKKAALRGSGKLTGESEDTSWKTVPSTKSKGGKKSDGKVKSKTAQRTWENWAGPIK